MKPRAGRKLVDYRWATCVAALAAALCAASYAQAQSPDGNIELLQPPSLDWWREPPVVVLHVPDGRTDGGQYARDRSHALMAHQEALPRPEDPPGEPAPIIDALPSFAEQAWPTPSCATCGSGCGGCIACEPCVAHTRAGRFACGLYNSLCCPHPCYEPRWTGIANASFWVESARPITQVRYRWDWAWNLVYPDRAEYIWPAVGVLGPRTAPTSIELHELTMYTEVASGGFSFFFDTPYRSYDADFGGHAAGFSDINLGTKSVIFDAELLQITFQFRTWIPSGIGLKGLGTQHVSLEPSLLFALNISPDTYAQAQIAEWIPISADQAQAGAILHYHASLNHVLWRWQPSVPIIGTLEANGWSFQDGQYTDPALGVLAASGETYVSAGPGLRVVVCDKIDFGIGSAFSLTENHWGEQTLRSEFRWRF